MAAFLTALANIGNQYGTAKADAADAMAKRQAQAQEYQIKLAQLGAEQTNQQIAQKRLQMEEAQASRPLVYQYGGQDYVYDPDLKRNLNAQELKERGYQDTQSQRMAAAQGLIDESFKKGDPLGVEAQAILSMARQTGAYDKAEDRILALAKEARTAEAKKAIGIKTTGVKPEILAQYPHPDPDKYEQGVDDPLYIEAVRKWGQDVQKASEEEAAAPRVQGAKAWARNKTGMFITPTGARPMTWGEAMDNNYPELNSGLKVKELTNRVELAYFDAGVLNNAIDNLQPGDAFSPAAAAQLNAAMHLMDMGIATKVPVAPEVFQNILQSAAMGSLNDRQQQYAAALISAMESAMGMASIGGAGRATDTSRRAIQAMIPGPNMSKPFAKKQMALYMVEIQKLGQLPSLSVQVPSVVGTTPNAPSPSFSPATDFPNAPQSPVPDDSKPPAARPDPSNPLGLKLD